MDDYFLYFYLNESKLIKVNRKAKARGLNGFWSAVKMRETKWYFYKNRLAT